MPSVAMLADPTTTLLGGGVVLLSLLWWLSTRRPPGIPPGPGPALPFMGHLHLLEKDPRQKFSQWRQQYGDVFSLYMCQRLVVVLNGYDVIKEALVQMADVFSDRPRHFFLKEKVWKNAGILINSGQTWKDQRKTALEVLRQLGMGKNSLAEKIQEEVTYYIRAIEDRQGAPEELAHLTQVSVSNNICSIVFGQRFQYDDPEFKSYLHSMDELLSVIGASAVQNFLPLVEYIPGDPFNGKKAIKIVEDFEEAFLKKQLQSHLNTYDREHIDDFIHGYIDQMNTKQQAGTETTLSERHLLKVLLELFVAGTETTTTTIGWGLLYFLHYPEVQEKCYKEICSVVGTSRLPNMADKPEMTYLEATIMEILRIGEILPIALLHSTASDTTFRGYFIPRDAIVMVNLSSIMRDPALWGDPDNFRPERFIGPDGKLIRREELIPFGLGRRVCLGESLARMELFLYLSTLIQRFRFLPPDPEKPPPPFEGTFGITYVPKPYKIRAVLRQ